MRFPPIEARISIVSLTCFSKVYFNITSREKIDLNSQVYIIIKKFIIGRIDVCEMLIYCKIFLKKIVVLCFRTIALKYVNARPLCDSSLECHCERGIYLDTIPPFDHLRQCQIIECSSKL